MKQWVMDAYVCLMNVLLKTCVNNSDHIVIDHLTFMMKRENGAFAVVGAAMGAPSSRLT